MKKQNEYSNFDAAMKAVLKVSHKEIKDKLDAACGAPKEIRTPDLLVRS